ncbi:DUF1844 domain-containing protein [Thermodesulfatator atlanticus]|uniref:DUF1844 domain-containing protein n=1 Tax=Thermodesulfatator atlanticus TaxID=501497 RepID=UPI0003B5451C|nr:DUF1844 domain-containing protein [Thermodesulfatator atlanticus]
MVEEKEKREDLPPVNFSMFILSLNTSALVHLGELPDPHSQQKKKDLALARQTIDILDMLKEKTRGNLTREEEKLLDTILYELRMIYLRVSGGK